MGGREKMIVFSPDDKLLEKRTECLINLRIISKIV